MAKKGRPPKAKAIEPIAPAAWDRIKRHVEAGVLEPVHGSELGRLSYHGKLSPTQTSAGFRVGEIYGRYERLIVGRRRSAVSPSYQSGFSEAGETLDELLHNPNIEKCQCRLCSARAAWTKLQDRLNDFSHQARTQLEALCVEDTPINPAQLADMATLLDVLAIDFGIVSAGKKVEIPKGNLRARLNGSTAPAPVVTSTPRINIELHCFRMVVGKLVPKLEPNQLDRAYEVFTALKARERFRLDKKRASGNS